MSDEIRSEKEEAVVVGETHRVGLLRVSFEILASLFHLPACNIKEVYQTDEDLQRGTVVFKVEGPLIPPTPVGERIPFLDLVYGRDFVPDPHTELLSLSTQQDPPHVAGLDSALDSVVDRINRKLAEQGEGEGDGNDT